MPNPIKKRIPSFHQQHEAEIKLAHTYFINARKAAIEGNLSLADDLRQKGLAIYDRLEEAQAAYREQHGEDTP